MRVLGLKMKCKTEPLYSNFLLYYTFFHSSLFFWCEVNKLKSPKLTWIGFWLALFFAILVIHTIFITRLSFFAIVWSYWQFYSLTIYCCFVSMLTFTRWFFKGEVMIHHVFLKNWSKKYLCIYFCVRNIPSFPICSKCIFKLASCQHFGYCFGVATTSNCPLRTQFGWFVFWWWPF